MKELTRYQQARRITLISVGANILLGFTKIIGGVIGNSHALFADGVHSASDLLTDILVLLAAKFGNHDADAEHPYGHRRIETVGTVVLALILVIVGIFIVVDAGNRLILGKAAVIPHAFTFWVAVFSIIANEVLFRATLRVAEATKSNLLRANAWHHRSDAASSLVVVVGIGGALLGYAYLDSIAAVLVALFIVKMGVELAWTSVRELVDTGLEPMTLARIQRIIMDIAGVKAIHQLRTRTMANEVFLDVHVQVSPYLSVSEGHYIAQKVHYTLMAAIHAVTDVTVHIDPEDDAVVTPAADLPLRDVLEPLLKQRWAGLAGADRIERLVLHYLEGKLHVEVELAAATLKDIAEARTLAGQYRKAVEDVPEIESVKLLFQ